MNHFPHVPGASVTTTRQKTNNNDDDSSDEDDKMLIHPIARKINEWLNRTNDMLQLDSLQLPR